MTDKDSLDNVLRGDYAWREEITDTIGEFDSWILVGTKSDLWDEWKDSKGHKDQCVSMEDCYKVRLSQICSGVLQCFLLGRLLRNWEPRISM